MITIRVLLLSVMTAGCIWLPLGSDAIPRVELREVQRSSALAEWTGTPAREPDGRGMFFQDSLIAFRTEATAEGVRFRLWNRTDGLMRIVWDPAAVGTPVGQCPAVTLGWEMRWRGGGPPADVVPARGSREDEAVAVARVPTLQGGLWTSVPLECVADGAEDGRAPLRLTVMTEEVRYVYTFWYGAAKDGSPPAAAGGEAPLGP